MPKIRDSFKAMNMPMAEWQINSNILLNSLRIQPKTKIIQWLQNQN
ncbi:MAG: hypothetical protein NTY88_14205 [Bacteroidetes bacterium]|nr:hypothetical protein [Bacteroidota bacterium]